MDNLYGLIGYPLSHSFSKKYFTEKFAREGLTEHRYELFEIDSVKKLPDIIAQHPDLRGLNVTIPYKEAVLPFLDKQDKSAKRVGAVNVIKVANNKLTGYNSDYYGFEQSLLNWLPTTKGLKALVLGTGGAAKAVVAVLKANHIEFKLVSRQKTASILSYADLTKEPWLNTHRLIINTTPLGMAPATDRSPDLPYEQFSPEHFAYDLIYNPAQTTFLQKAAAKGAATKNGLEMLELQAEKSWDIWTS